MTRHIANILTSCRILGSILLLFFPVFSSSFYITYLLCGFSDMIDGTIARKTNIKIGNIIRGYVSKKQFISLHTRMNKITGLLLFLLPLTLSFIELEYSSIVACLIATFAAIREGIYVIIGYKENYKNF